MVSFPSRQGDDQAREYGNYTGGGPGEPQPRLPGRDHRPILQAVGTATTKVEPRVSEGYATYVRGVGALDSPRVRLTRTVGVHGLDDEERNVEEERHYRTGQGSGEQLNPSEVTTCARPSLSPRKGRRRSRRDLPCAAARLSRRSRRRPCRPRRRSRRRAPHPVRLRRSP